MYKCPYCDEWMDYHIHHRPCPTLVTRVAAIESQLEQIGIALEWPPQEEDTTLLDAVKEAACNGVLLCETRARVAVLEAELARERGDDELFDQRLVEARDAGYHLGLDAPSKADIRVAELEAAAKPRPLPRPVDGLRIWGLVCLDACPIEGDDSDWEDINGQPFPMELCDGWCPWPDQRVEVDYATARDMAVNDEL